jgi:ABC-type enterochelin transport system permease subunit
LIQFLFLGCGDNVYIPNLLEYESDSFPIKVFSKIPSLSAEIANCSLVIGHAGLHYIQYSSFFSDSGVGTIFESLGMEKRLVVVPNTRLMNNHQLEIANELVCCLVFVFFSFLLFIYYYLFYLFKLFQSPFCADMSFLSYFRDYFCNI